MAELTAAGFERRNRLEILEDVYTRMRDLFGPQILLTEDSVAGKFAALLAEFQLDNERLAEELYENRKVSSAEGIYLDDILNRYGVYRRGPVAGTGLASVQYESSITPPSTEISTVGTFTANNGVIYRPITTTNVYNAFSGMVLSSNELNPGAYTATIGAATPFNANLSDTNLFNKGVLLEALRDYIIDNTTDNNLICFVVDTSLTEKTLYVGYTSSDNYVGLSEAVSFSMSPKVGQWWSQVSVRASVAGFKPLDVEGITGYSPAFTGYLDASNGIAFVSGSEAETDAEFFQRWTTTPSLVPLGTRDGVVRSILNVDGVTKVRIFDNPGVDDTPEADGLTFNTLVVGGINEEVAQAIYESKPINAGTSGTVTVAVDTLDGVTEDINFSRPVEVPISIRVNYTPANGVNLNVNEETSVKSELVDLIAENDVGATLYNSDMEGAVYCILAPRRLRALSVEIKNKADPDTSYSTADFPIAFNEVLTLLEADITFVSV